MLEEHLAGEGNGFKHPLRNAFLGGMMLLKVIGGFLGCETKGNVTCFRTIYSFF
jgi:hypothetical protein